MEEITPKDSMVPVYLVPPTKSEIAELQKLAQEEAAREAEFKAEEAKKQKSRESAIAKLAKLGLTPDEVQAITG